MIQPLFFIGLALGVALSLPAAWWWTRRTERRVRRAEQRAQTAERLAELGTLTGGLAHEIKNPLSTLGLHVQLLSEDLDEIARLVEPDSVAADRLGRVQKRFLALGRETGRLREILEDFLRFAGRVELERAETDLNDLVAELVDFFEPQARASSISVRTQLGAAPSAVSADASLLKQAVLNLMLNAAQAMTEARDGEAEHGGAGELILRTDRRRVLGQDHVELHVIDTGPGMSPEVVSRVFQPYFSTKRGGTGLGLPTARRIVEEHGGELSVHAAPGRGTDFTVRLPALGTGAVPSPAP